jgi:hypothetical protein
MSPHVLIALFLPPKYLFVCQIFKSFSLCINISKFENETLTDSVVVPAGKITDQSEMKKFSERMDVQGPEDFFLKLSLNESLIPDTWQRIRSFYFGEKAIPEADDLIKVRQVYERDVSNSTQIVAV